MNIPVKTLLFLFFCWCIEDLRVFYHVSELTAMDDRLREERKHRLGVPMPCLINTRAWPLNDYVYIGWAAHQIYKETGEFPCEDGRFGVDSW